MVVGVKFRKEQIVMIAEAIYPNTKQKRRSSPTLVTELVRTNGLTLAMGKFGSLRPRCWYGESVSMGLAWAALHGLAMGLAWAWHGSAMGLPWVCHGSAMVRDLPP